MTLDFIVPMLILLQWRTNIPFLDQMLEKLSKLSGGREEIVLLALFILLVLFLLFIRRVIRKRRQKEA